MKKIDLKTRKIILLDLLAYVDKICRENKIKYSLIGGSLIGAVRHKGFIPWDDDIDIILLPDDYKRLIKLLSRYNKKYLLLNPELSNLYPYPFAKLVNKNTVLFEKGVKKIDGYGVYIDIFVYHYVSDNKIIRFIDFARLKTIKKILGIRLLNFQELKKSHEIYRMLAYSFVAMMPIDRLKRIYMKRCNNTKTTNHLLTNWPVYGFTKEIQNIKSFEYFQDCNFENLRVMICGGYKEVLINTFGDYMQLPPANQRKSNHSDMAYWKDKK